METEIWPNILRQSRRAGVPVIFANARISNRSFRNYRLINRFFNQFISSSLNNAAAFLAQSAEDASRLIHLGADESRIEVAGNLKYDLSEPPAGPFLHWLRDQVHSQERWPVVVAGSVAADEEESVLAAFDVVQRQWRRALLILAPRKPARFERAAEIVIQDGWLVSRRSNISWDAPLKEDADVLLLDSMGELGAVYGLADAVFVGGSLVPAGGHNLLEPALYARPPVGPYMQNFQEMAAQFLSARAGFQVRSAQELGLAWVKVIGSDTMTRQMGQAALALVLRHRGATERTLARISEILSPEFGQDWPKNAAARGRKSTL
jgi:3-deoxy-D-manno-octulosonic-acid transferase